MTSIGINRERYATLMRELDPRPSRFTDPAAYAQWCARADKATAVSVWADGFGNWHARVPVTIDEPQRLAHHARAAIKRELVERGNGLPLGPLILKRVASTATHVEYVEA